MFVVELGDLIDAADSVETEQRYLKTINREFSAISNDRHYCTLVAMVEGSGAENNGYSIMEIAPDGTIRLTGFRKQKEYDWKRVSATSS